MAKESAGRDGCLGGQLCIVTSNYYPESIGGIETFIGQYCRFLSTQRIPFTVISASSARRRAGIEPAYIRPFSIPIANYEVYNLLWSAIAALKIIKIHSRHRIGLVHSVDTGHAGLASVFASRFLRCRLIVHSHGRRSDTWRKILGSTEDWRASLYWVLQRFIDRFVATRASKVIAVSSEVYSFLISLGVQNDRILLAPSAIEITAFSEHQGSTLREELLIDEDCFVIGYLGRLSHLKGVEILIEAFAKFMEISSGKSIALIAGDGPLRSDFEAQAKAKGLKNVIFLGVESNAAHFLAALDVFVLPSIVEGSPLSLLEAMAAGCPIVASDIRSVREVAGDSILVFRPGDDVGLANLLLQLKMNPTKREVLSKAALFRSRTYSTSSVFPKILTFSLDS